MYNMEILNIKKNSLITPLDKKKPTVFACMRLFDIIMNVCFRKKWQFIQFFLHLTDLNVNLDC